MITVLASSVCGLGTIITRDLFHSPNAKIVHFGCYYICNGMLSGVISVSAACTGIEIWQGIIISLAACLFYQIGSRFLTRYEIDDPLEASIVYGVQGFWSIVAAGIFDREKGWLQTGNFS